MANAFGLRLGSRASLTWVGILGVALLLHLCTRSQAQSRGVYPAGMSALNSGLTPEPGFTYSNQLLFYSRDQAKSDDGSPLPITGSNSVVLDMNSLVWVSRKTILNGAYYSAIATLPFAKNDLTSDILGNISGGSGFADSYFVPLVLGWNKESVSIRVLYGFLAPTGRFAVGANDNVGSGYWTQTLSSGQTFYLTKGKLLMLSAYELYEFHTIQEGTGTHPGDTFDLDYSVARTFSFRNRSTRLQIGVAGYEMHQTTAKTGPAITLDQSRERYAVNAIGFASSVALPRRNFNLTMKFFKEFANRATFQGYSLQVSGGMSF